MVRRFRFRIPGAGFRLYVVAGGCVAVAFAILTSLGLRGDEPDVPPECARNLVNPFSPAYCPPPPVTVAGQFPPGAGLSAPSAPSAAAVPSAPAGPAVPARPMIPSSPAAHGPVAATRSAEPARRAPYAQERPRSQARRPAPVPTLTVEYNFKSRWDTGYVVNISFTNTTSTAFNGWVLNFRLGGGSRVVSPWNTQLTQDGAGRVRAADDGFNAAVPPGGQAGFGFEGSGSFQPSECVLNGLPCRFAGG